MNYTTYYWSKWYIIDGLKGLKTTGLKPEPKGMLYYGGVVWQVNINM
jgi:hypothetical protein